MLLSAGEPTTISSANSATRSAIPWPQGTFNNVSPPGGGHNQLALKKSDFTEMTPSVLNDAAQPIRAIRFQFAASAGPVYFRGIRWNVPRVKPTIIIGIDDAPDTLYSNLWPMLKRYGLPAITYVIGGRVGTTGYMTEAQLNEWDAAGMELGNHTYDHFIATNYATEAAARNYQSNIIRNAGYLAQRWPSNPGIKHFAYPGGHCVAGIHDRLIKLGGFKSARVVNMDRTRTNTQTGHGNPFRMYGTPWNINDTPETLLAAIDNLTTTRVGSMDGACELYLHGVGDYTQDPAARGPDYTTPLAVAEGLCAGIAARRDAGTHNVMFKSQWARLAGISD